MVAPVPTTESFGSASTTTAMTSAHGTRDTYLHEIHGDLKPVATAYFIANHLKSRPAEVL